MKDKLKNNFQLTVYSRQLTKMLLLIVNGLLLTFFLFSCDSDKKESHEGHNHSQEEMYYCPMDTDIVRKEPGVCPKCNMALVKKENGKKDTIYYCPMCPGQEQKKPGICKICNMDLVVKPDSSQTDAYSLIVNPSNVTVLSSIKAIKPVRKSIPIVIKTFGYVKYDTRRIYTISSRVEGRVEKLYVKFPFQPIKKGQPLLEIFSHELLSAQNEYFLIKERDPEASDLINAAREKLLLLGMTESQINNLKHDGHAHSNTTIYSPYTGYVVENMPEDVSSNSMNTSSNIGKMNNNSEMGNTPMKENNSMSENNGELILREGAYLNKGVTVFKVVNTDMVWGIFEVYSDQLPLIKLNQSVNIKIENTDRLISGKVDFIEPGYQEGSKTSRFRVYLENKNQKLKIGNLLTGEIGTRTNQAIWIPQSAVYDLGIDKIVFIKKEGGFETRKIITGIISSNFVEIVSGLNENEEIAENAQFMVDSESFIKVRNE